MRSAVGSSIAGVTCAYTSAVVLIVEWPRIRETTTSSSPASRWSVAQACRRSWNRCAVAQPAGGRLGMRVSRLTCRAVRLAASRTRSHRHAIAARLQFVPHAAESDALGESRPPTQGEGSASTRRSSGSANVRAPRRSVWRTVRRAMSRSTSDQRRASSSPCHMPSATAVSVSGPSRSSCTDARNTRTCSADSGWSSRLTFAGGWTRVATLRTTRPVLTARPSANSEDRVDVRSARRVPAVGRSTPRPARRPRRSSTSGASRSTATSTSRSARPWPAPGPTATSTSVRSSASTCRPRRATRFDQNITGFRAEEEFGFNAEPYVRPASS